tara:strand:- start:3372 stop:3632 length:261 start_codon:yes stop_codon:yes gene_type:complete
MTIELSKEGLEKALGSDNADSETKTDEAKIDLPEISKEEEIGVHKGSLNTLAAERIELAKMIGNVEAIMQAHLKRLEELGVNPKEK